MLIVFVQVGYRAVYSIWYGGNFAKAVRERRLGFFSCFVSLVPPQDPDRAVASLTHRKSTVLVPRDADLVIPFYALSGRGFNSQRLCQTVGIQCMQLNRRTSHS